MGTKKIDESVPKSVIDTNVFISALLFVGKANILVNLWQNRSITYLLSEEVLKEYIKVLSYPKFQLSGEDIKYIIEYELIPYIQPITTTSHIRIIKEDPADNEFLSLALDGKADCIISGDKHLLDQKRFHSIHILTIQRFLETYFPQK
jgi:putative PIN family toxin of toxin-antitoxin system